MGTVTWWLLAYLAAGGTTVAVIMFIDDDNGRGKKGVLTLAWLLWPALLLGLAIMTGFFNTVAAIAWARAAPCLFMRLVRPHGDPRIRG